MTGVILAVLGRSETAPSVLGAAERLCALSGQAKLIALATGMPVQGGPLAADALIAEAAYRVGLHELDRKRMAALTKMAQAWAEAMRGCGTAAEWRVAEGGRAEVKRFGRRADLIVIARPIADDDAHTRSILQAALLGCERPVLVVPPGPAAPFGRIVAIAWRNDGCAAKAVIPALRLLAGASELHVLEGVRGGVHDIAVPVVFASHGLTAQMHVLDIEGVFGQVLLDKAHAVGADMLVMGAYAHGRLHEMMFGGVTRFMLAHADLPVLMRH